MCKAFCYSEKAFSEEALLYAVKLHQQHIKWKNAFKDAYYLYTWLTSQCERHKEVAPYRQSLEYGFAVLHGVLECRKQSLSKYFKESKLDITYLCHLAVYTMHN